MGEPRVKKSVTEHGIAQRHVMIEQASQQHPELSIERLCELFDVVAAGTTNVAASSRATQARQPYAMKLNGSSSNFQAMAIDE